MKKRAPGCLGYLRDEILPSYIGVIINHEIRIPNYEGFFRGSCVFFKVDPDGDRGFSMWWFQISNIFYFDPGSLGRWSNLTSIFFRWVETRKRLLASTITLDIQTPKLRRYLDTKNIPIEYHSHQEVLLMAEILHHLIGSLSHYLQGFSTIPGGWDWDFSHQQYDWMSDGSFLCSP